MAINKTTLLSQLTAMLEHGHDENIVFPFILVDGKKYDTLTTDNNEVGILSADGTWFIPLQELTINELKGLKSLMAEN